ncbi:type IV toxin-antitoxin system AbiEi family antitoxin domain-containing protein [Breznakia pachnodae]|uniref:Transcriptional regulator of viral defense system n=1 Tax=Breznakia pachnodae TaxID=265178 RepID=A0ABU0DZZ1_9FIRM|nr:abortive phage infection protein [Breznakia pachnodae]MDQ0360202.1 putative transcriptional regulator of viral defense system [Breznakia pachnodae]
MKNINDARFFVNQSNGIITNNDFKENDIGKYFVNMLLEEGTLERYQKGIYVRNDTFEDEFYILQKKNPTIVFSYNSAMYLLNHTDRTPFRMDITVYQGYNVHRLPKDIKVHYVKKELLNLGTIKVKTPFGFEVITYNIERIICDLIKNRNTGIDKEQSNKFIREMFLEKKVNTTTLINYAKQLNCENKVRTVMDLFI